MTDFASVPRIFWVLFPPDGKYTRAAVIHDYLCTTHEVPRWIADRIFLREMKEQGQVVAWKARMMFTAVRLYAILRRIK